MKIVILGAAGQLGRQLSKVLPGEVLGLARGQADLTNSVRLRETLAQLRPDVVVNASGYTRVDAAEAEQAEAFAVNAYGVGALAEVCRDLDCTLIHFSTDYVFGLDAGRRTPYGEADVAGPINVYGASKRAGEQQVQDVCPKHFILRTCGLYGSGSPNFVATMLRLADEGKSVRVVNDQRCTPTSTADLAQATCVILGSTAFGLYHVTNAGDCTWYEFARTLFAITKKSPPLTPITSAEYGAAAGRPRYSVLSNERWIAAGFVPLRPWQAALESFLLSRET